MKKHKLSLVIVMTTLAITARGMAAQQGQWQDIGGGDLRFSAVWVEPGRDQAIIAGSSGWILKTENGGKDWRRILSIRSNVNRLVAGDSHTLLAAATENGLYLSRDHGSSWKRVFKGRDDLERSCSSFAFIKGMAYLGTKAGLFVSSDNCRSWRKEAGIPVNSRVFSISVDAGNIYVASAQGIFKAGYPATGWQRIFIPSAGIDSDVPEDPVEEDGNEVDPDASGSCFLAVDPGKSGHLYLAAAGKVYESADSGIDWDVLQGYGLLDRSINSLFVSADSRLFANTKKGVFLYQGGRWYEITVGLVGGDVRGIDCDKQGILYLASDNGLFKACVGPQQEITMGRPQSLYLADEPDIREVHNAAIRYAEVEPEKIMRWRKQAARKAFLPKLTAGVNRDTGDLWHWESGSTTKAYDDVLMRGRDAVGWDVTLSWDLSEIIWNSDQTSIDARSRLMVQLRGDILDEVTKLYFERIRLKAELDNLALEDRKKRLEKEIRLRELTAMLDGLTGGYFSRNRP